MGGASGEEAESLIPIATMESLKETLTYAEDLRSNLLQFLSTAEPEALAEMPPLHRARAFLALSKAATALFSARLRCNGIDPDEHPIRKELDRLSLYEEKLERFDHWSKAPLRPSTTLNSQAAARFIGHSLPDLTPEQKKGMRDLSRADGVRSRAQKKRKHQLPEKPSVRMAAQEFLEKAARELLSSSNSGVKGPLQNISDDEDEDENVE
ncbi:uncharacterized protein [Typha latifolia]|uniref:uncharacterized protein n=1 Tax=Typha latifolia TaxID=4733 RepID=UPI003C2E279F